MTKWANPETVKWWRRRSKRRRRRIDNLPEKDGRWVGRGGGLLDVGCGCRTVAIVT